jgi:hypothetical protein
VAVGRISLRLEIEGLREIQRNLRQAFSPSKRASIIAKAMEKAVVPVELALKRLAPLGPTGNLREAATSVVVPYPLDGNAVGLVGFLRTGERESVSAQGGAVQKGPDRAFHQYWLEEGTDERQFTKPSDTAFYRRPHSRTRKTGNTEEVSGHMVVGQGGYIASSFNKLGPFKMIRDPSRKSRVVTDPPYFYAFFMKKSTPFSIRGVTPGGTNGTPPLQAAFDETQSTVAEILSRELRISLEEIWVGLRTSTSPIGTLP